MEAGRQGTRIAHFMDDIINSDHHCEETGKGITTSEATKGKEQTDPFQQQGTTKTFKWHCLNWMTLARHCWSSR